MPEQLTDEARELLSALVKERTRELFAEDAGKHREYLDSVFNRLTWALGILVVAVGVFGTWTFGESVEAAANGQVRTFMNEERVREQLQTQIDDAIRKASPQLEAEALRRVKVALESQVGQDLQDAVAAKAAEIRGVPAASIVADSLRGPSGPEGPTGKQGPPGLDGLPLGTILSWVPQSGQGTSTTPPIGWRICDGRDGTPDLRNGILVGGPVLAKHGRNEEPGKQTGWNIRAAGPGGPEPDWQGFTVLFIMKMQ